MHTLLLDFQIPIQEQPGQQPSHTQPKANHHRPITTAAAAASAPHHQRPHPHHQRPNPLPPRPRLTLHRQHPHVALKLNPHHAHRPLQRTLGHHQFDQLWRRHICHWREGVFVRTARRQVWRWVGGRVADARPHGRVLTVAVDRSDPRGRTGDDADFKRYGVGELVAAADWAGDGRGESYSAACLYLGLVFVWTCAVWEAGTTCMCCCILGAKLVRLY